MGFSQDFLEKSILLVLTAGLSGFLIPYVLKQTDERKLRQQKIVDERKLEEQKEFDARRLQKQKEFDADLIRQSKVIEAQAQLLDTLTHLLWELQLLSLSVSYYKVYLDQQKHEVAFKEYDEESWLYFRKIRCEISKAARLTSKNLYDTLMSFFTDRLIAIDEELMTLIKKEASPEEWKTHHERILLTLPKEIDKIVGSLAEELRLSSSKTIQ